MKRIEIMKGDKISLVVLDKQDVNEWYEGMNNIETNLYLGNGKDIYHMEDIENLYDERIKEKDSVYLSIYDKKNKSVIGMCGIENIRDLTMKAELYLFIYDKKNHNKGYGKETIKLLIDYGFDILGLNKLWLSYIEGNENAKKLYEKSGFTEVGRFKNDIFVRGNLRDLIYMEIYKK